MVAVHGGIIDGRSRQGGPGPGGRRAGADTVVAALRAAGENDRVKAVVLHIDSPGGSYVASDAIRRAVLQLRATGRPVVAAMGDVAASGGYFAAMPTDRIFALPTTITGSIGVLAGKFVVSELVQRLGVVRELVATGPNSTMFAPDVGFTDAQRMRLEAWLDEVYEDFTRKAAQDRGMAWEDLEPLARGRVWMGTDALRHGLVDELGGRAAAIAHACRLAGFSREGADVVSWPHLSLIDRVKPAESSHAPGAAMSVGRRRSARRPGSTRGSPRRATWPGCRPGCSRCRGRSACGRDQPRAAPLGGCVRHARSGTFGRVPRASARATLAEEQHG